MAKNEFYRSIAALKRQVQAPYTRGDITASLIAIIVAGLFMLSDTSAAEKAIAIFGAAIITLRTGSILCFVLSAVCLVNIITLFAIGKERFAETLAVCAFYFLFIGAISLMLENSSGRKFAVLTAKLSRKK